MKKVMVGVAVALALVTSQAAADGIERRPPPVIAAPQPYAPPPTWSGFYIGGGIGAGAVVNDISVDDRFFNERLFEFNGGDDGVFGTAIIGWDWQIGVSTVFGVFADWDFLNFSTHHRVGAGEDFFDHSSNHDNAWSVGARLGWLSSPFALWYITGGFTQLQLDHSATFSFDGNDFTGSRDRRLDGFFVGAGVDTRLAASNWFLRLEYRFSDYNTGRISIRDDASDLDMRINNDVNTHTARATLTYKFSGYGWNGWNGWGR